MRRIERSVVDDHIAMAIRLQHGDGSPFLVCGTMEAHDPPGNATVVG